MKRSTSAIVVVLLLLSGAALLLRHNPFLAGYLTDSRTVNGEDFTIVSQVAENETFPIPAGEHVLIQCDASITKRGINPSDFPVTGLKMYEYTPGFSHEKGRGWYGEHFGYESVNTLSEVKPGRIYYVYSDTGFGFTCVQPQCNDGIDNDGDGLADRLDPGCNDALDSDESNALGSCTQELLWTAGTFDYANAASDEDQNGAKEYPANDAYSAEYFYSVQSAHNGAPYMPGMLATTNMSQIDPSRRQTDVTRRLYISFSAPSQVTQAHVIFSRYGTEPTDVGLDGSAVTSVAGSSASNSVHTLSLPDMAAGAHTLSFLYTNTSGNGTYIDAIALRGCLSDTQTSGTFPELLIGNLSTLSSLSPAGQSVILDQADNIGTPRSVAVDPVNNKIYWTDESGIAGGTHRILSANIDGTSIQTIFTTTSLISDIDLDIENQKIYWVERNPNRIMRANVDGTLQQQTVSAANLTDPYGITVDMPNDRIYFSDAGGIRRANLDGTGLATIVAGGTGVPVPRSVAVGSGTLFWGDAAGNIKRSSLTGTAVTTLAVETTPPNSQVYINDVIVDLLEETVYWNSFTVGVESQAIRRVPIAGGTIDTVWAGGIGNNAVFSGIAFLSPILPFLP